MMVTGKNHTRGPLLNRKLILGVASLSDIKSEKYMLAIFIDIYFPGAEFPIKMMGCLWYLLGVKICLLTS